MILIPIKRAVTSPTVSKTWDFLVPEVVWQLRGERERKRSLVNREKIIN